LQELYDYPHTTVEEIEVKVGSVICPALPITLGGTAGMHSLQSDTRAHHLPQLHAMPPALLEDILN